MPGILNSETKTQQYVTRCQNTLAALKTIKFSGQLVLLALLSLLMVGFAIAKEPNNEGIKVHGEWLITVTNPDGAIVQERVVHNALETGGAAMLVGLLTGSRTMRLNPDDTPDCPIIVYCR
jgi:hypothetical protein